MGLVGMLGGFSWHLVVFGWYGVKWVFIVWVLVGLGVLGTGVGLLGCWVGFGRFIGGGFGSGVGFIGLGGGSWLVLVPWLVLVWLRFGFCGVGVCWALRTLGFSWWFVGCWFLRVGCRVLGLMVTWILCIWLVLG